MQLFPVAVQDFKGWIMRGVDEQLRDALVAAEPGEAEDALFNLFARFVLANFNDQIKMYRWAQSDMARHSVQLHAHSCQAMSITQALNSVCWSV